MNFFVAFLALLMDRFAPTFPSLVSRIGHPVIWQGWLIARLEQRLNRPGASAKARRRGGQLMLLVLIAVTFGAAFAAQWLIGLLPFAPVFQALVASVFLAHKSLFLAVERVAEALQKSPAQAREAVAHIVGRDTRNLDAHEISRAAIESLAENSSDGVIAPLFWLAIFGLPGIAVYKAINTADSMVGHRNDRYRDFGRASARLDDLVNWLPARLTALFYGLAAFITSPQNGRAAWRAAMRDAPAHTSPNAGWPEAALAGALGFGLGGTRAYGGKILHLPEMGRGRRDLQGRDIRQALKLFQRMSLVALFLSAALASIQIGQLSL